MGSLVVSQYDVVLVNLDPTIGSEVQKTRPCVVISPDEMNRPLNTVTIAPMTSTSKPYPSRVEVRSENRTGWVMIDQLRTIDRMRIVKVLGKLTTDQARAIKQVIQALFVD